MIYKYSQKQLEVLRATLRNELGFVNILEGAVRSGKTFICNLAWCLYVINSQYDIFLMSGESTDSLYRNVISDIELIMGKNRVNFQESAKGGAQLIINFNGHKKICYCRGGSKANDEGKIRGITIAGWYADEITLHHETFVKQALNRMSLPNSKAIWTTNPDTPAHFINKEYREVAEEKRYKHWHFELDDNLSLTEEYKQNIKKAYTGTFYQRFILGQWVCADGVIFDMWTKENEIEESELPGTLRSATRYIAIDYGTTNPMCFLDIWDDGVTAWIVREYYYDSKKEMKQKTDKQYADDLVKFIGSDYPRAIILDPSAASFKAELRSRGLRIKDADNEVNDGIRMTSSMIAQRKIKAVAKKCPCMLDDISAYIWDEKAKERGEEKPVKEHDHACDALRYFVKTIIKPRRLAT